MMTIFVRLPLFYNSFCNNTDVAHILESFLFQTIIDELLMKYKVSLLEGQDLTHKWLPVSRPKKQVLVQFTQREPVDDKTEETSVME